ncbi:immunity 21 family protein [Streptomyces cinnabarinus]|uniref:Immunity 21 family protein n=1 Tax=Streptomyces cinnabarinus TaxID=67287 RepID=A0ABY7KAG0_9ACTN|nr:immunity 21 family protein [Streptomyces cinnabarinus]WAZ20107.1 immunity 21 family protein [Streptomyces cinnabarinus]
MVRHRVRWVESGGGPLIAVPETVLPFWAGADGDETASDYDRACDIDGPVGLLPVGDSAALVLGDEPAATAYLPDHGTFVRWCAADSEAELLSGVPAALDAAEWGEEVRWKVPGPVFLFDSAWPGTETARAAPLCVTLTPGAYGVRAAWVRPGPETWLGLVRLRALAG